ncbi:hypothetical protein GCM10020001_072400 [Nonomuraea salmonea]
MAADGGGAAHLRDVDRVAVARHRHADGLADLLGQAQADGAALARQVEAGGGRAGQPYDAEPEPVAPAIAALFDEPALFEGR